MKRITCDKCGTELAPFRPEWSSVEITLPTKTLNIDLCKTCLVRLDDWCTRSDPVAA